MLEILSLLRESALPRTAAGKTSFLPPDRRLSSPSLHQMHICCKGVQCAVFSHPTNFGVSAREQ